jgi:RNA polymerase sigma factor (sigma-70 family)
MLMVQPDSVLCKLCARGSDDAFDVLHGRYRQQVFAFVFHLLNRRDGVDDAEDLTQEVFGKAFASIRSKNSDGSFKHWLFTIARNATFDLIRARKPQAVPIDETSDSRPEFANVVSISSQVENRAEFAWLVETMRALPERQREALVMRELGGLTHAEIAGELGTSVDATKQLIKRGRKSVGESAQRSGYRSRNLSKDLAMAAPVVPLTAAGLGLTASGASAAAGIGGLALGTKVVAVAFAVVAIGGGGAAVKQAVTADHASNTSASVPVANQEFEEAAGAAPGLLGRSVPGLGDEVSAAARAKAAARKEARGRSAAAHAKHERRKHAKAARAKAEHKVKTNSGSERPSEPSAAGKQNAGGSQQTSKGKPEAPAPVATEEPSEPATGNRGGKGSPKN